MVDSSADLVHLFNNDPTDRYQIELSIPSLQLGLLPQFPRPIEEDYGERTASEGVMAIISFREAVLLNRFRGATVSFGILFFYMRRQPSMPCVQSNYNHDFMQ